MGIPAHTHGPSCRYHKSEPEEQIKDAEERIPKLNAQFFYTSSSLIDDPLSEVPTPNKATTVRLPFSIGDNSRLEEAWQHHVKTQEGRRAKKRKTARVTAEGVEKSSSRSRALSKSKSPLSQELSESCFDNARGSGRLQTASSDTQDSPRTSTSGTQKDEGESRIASSSGWNKAAARASTFPRTYSSSRERALDRELSLQKERDSRDSPMSIEAKSKPKEAAPESQGKFPQYSSSPSDRNTTGNPFQRSEPSPKQRIRAESIPSENKELSRIGNTSDSRKKLFETEEERSAASSDGQDSSEVSEPVGISRLHFVEVDTLEMKPIYWSPVTEKSFVQRGTWFYKENLLPVDSTVANWLEVGYQYMRPWTLTYKDELNSCIDVGPEAELKIVHKLVPSSETLPISIPEEAHATVYEQLNLDPLTLSMEYQDKKSSKEVLMRMHERSSVIYANATDAQILSPTQLPSLSRGRRPLGPIRRGRLVGIPVVRGFDRIEWDKRHPPKVRFANLQAREAAYRARSGTAATDEQRRVCQACLLSEEPSQVTDLVMVIHGIGQKLSERVDSFRFTHAINDFRRQVALIREAPDLQPVLRDKLGGIMVLPVNWRATFHPEGEGSKLPLTDSLDLEVNQPRDFSLTDVTGPSIPAVRELINDVMLDIPYFMSKHKGTMVQAMIKEANRIYRLWCRHNPEFHRSGRVHLIAHSLGSVMALDALSMQPTLLNQDLYLQKSISQDQFEFDTKNVFFCGSPVGFFLHLERAKLKPRRGRQKPGSEVASESVITGEAGEFGCMAIDNLYNIIHHYDPIAYRINPCVEVHYSKSLKTAVIPSVFPTWYQSLFRRKAQAIARPYPAITQTRPNMSKLPSTVELEVHNFDLEEMAEKKMFLLNDNGQIDWFLSTGGGALEFQYLTMLGAHSSYWTSLDFIRFLVLEVGREPGKDDAIPNIKAEKHVRWKKHIEKA